MISSKSAAYTAKTALVTAILSSATQLYATHFRYGHYNWKSVGGNTIEFTIQNAFRRDGYICRNPATLGVIACTGPGGLPGVGDVILETIGTTVFTPGDGSPNIGSPLGPLLYRVTSIDPDNWFFAVALDPASLPAVKTTITHTYPGPGNYLAFTDSCCRISALQFPNAHINNPDVGYRVETLVNVGTGNSSPVTALPPIVVCPINALCSFFVPASDPNGDPMRFRLSSSAEAATVFGPFTQPGPPRAPNSAMINSATGLYTWDTTGATLGPVGFNTLYSTQVTISDLDASGNVKSKVAIDFLIKLVPLTPPLPVFDQPPTPACGSTIIAGVGTTVSFLVQASIPSATKSVTLNAVGLPFGATMTPALPVTGNPVSSTFSWIPALAQTGSFVVTFEARDNVGQQVLCSVSLRVIQAVLEGRMTGGGSVFANQVRVTHGMELHCSVVDAPNNLEINWDGGNNFHLENLTSALCFTDPRIDSKPPPAGFNTYIGGGTGRLNGVSGATAQWVFTDAGEPGGNDTATIVIKSGSTVVLSVAGNLNSGNQQAHK